VTPPIKVFFSAAGQDVEAAGRLRDALARAGIAATTDADIAISSDWGEHLRAAMNASDAVIALFTPAAVSSAYVMSEVGAAIAAGKTVVPVVMTDRGLPAGLPAPLRRWHFIRAGKRNAADVADEIKQRLMQIPASAA
jgi:hypothetical protein